MQVRRENSIWLGVVVAAGTLGLATLFGAAGSPASAPPAHLGRFVWQDLVTRNPAACRIFYADLLGWEFEQTVRNGRDYFLAKANGEYVGGIIQAKDDEAPRAAWLSYLSVADLDATVAQVKAAGGKVLVEPREVGRFGRAAAIKDPQGAILGLAELAVEPRAEPAQPALDEFFWREYLAANAATAIDFYHGLAGYEASAGEQKQMVEYFILRRNARARGGLFQIPQSVSGVGPNWLPYVRVEDPVALAKRAVELGGKVLLAPIPEIRNGSLAIVADPTGGAIALQKWPVQPVRESS